MNSFVIKLNQKETEFLIEMIKFQDDYSEKNEIFGYEELIDFAENLLEQNTKYLELLSFPFCIFIHHP